MLFILQNAHDGIHRPLGLSHATGDLTLVQRPSQHIGACPVHIRLKHPLHDFCLFGVDNQVPVFILVVAIKAVRIHVEDTLFVKGANAPGGILRNGAAFILGKRSQNGEQQLAAAIHGVDAFLFKANANAHVLQLAGIIQAILGVTGKSGNGLGNHQVNFSCLAVSNHAVELVTTFGAGTRNALIGVNVHQFIFWVVVDVGGVVCHLVFKAVQLFLLCGGHSAISRHPQFLLRHPRTADHNRPLLCRDMKNLSCHA